MEVTRQYVEDSWLDERVQHINDRPLRLFDHAHFRNSILEVKAITSDLSNRFGVDFTVSYSVKTNPSADIISIVNECGIDAECISLAELDYVQRHGFNGRRCTLNGPGKWWPVDLLPAVQEPSVINGDSIADLKKTLEIVTKRGWESCALGLRVSAPGLSTRFGVDLEDPVTVGSLCTILCTVPVARPLGIHFHHAQSSIGTQRWVHAAIEAAKLAASTLKPTEHECVRFDLGGGWSTLVGSGFREGLAEACSGVLHYLNAVQVLQIEPGKMLTEDCGFVACRVLGKRGPASDPDLVVSAACSDVPDVISFRHDILWRKASGGPWRPLQRGSSRVLGRLCMEADILCSEVSIPAEIDEGDLIVICGTGAYDTSMAFSFGIGASER